MKAATAIHRIAFITAIVVYFVGSLAVLRQYPSLLQNVLNHPFAWPSLVLFGSLSGVAPALWPVCGWLATLLAGDRDLQ